MEVQFLGSYPHLDQLPAPGLPEFAFIGRSNVGKSSWINTLTRRKNLAHTSSTPGKTRMMNLYALPGEFIIVDLPGYGYARLSQKERVRMKQMVDAYLLEREALYLVFLLLDLRVTPQESDMSMLNWLGENGIPVALLYTKSDKLKPAFLDSQLALYAEVIGQNWETLPTSFVTSSETGLGRDEVLHYMRESILLNIKE
ncbi:MAG: YihA family ribosome biogenesis GTP-binding protein [Saprospiraceae bacterium]|nr:YihA family ribosome biogenesis GTP-binding protein [Saprospiraceae bacterium]